MNVGSKEQIVALSHLCVLGYFTTFCHLIRMPETDHIFEFRVHARCHTNFKRIRHMIQKI
jgi:hypothetical protein